MTTAQAWQVEPRVGRITCAAVATAEEIEMDFDKARVIRIVMAMET